MLLLWQNCFQDTLFILNSFSCCMRSSLFSMVFQSVLPLGLVKVLLFYLDLLFFSKHPQLSIVFPKNLRIYSYHLKVFLLTNP